MVEELCHRGIDSELTKKLERFWKEDDLSCDMDVTKQLALRDQKFHETIAEAYGNTTLLKRLKEINERIYAFRRVDFAREEIIGSVCEQHRKIARVIVKGDAEAVKMLMRENTKHVQENVESALQEMVMNSYLSSN